MEELKITRLTARRNPAVQMEVIEGHFATRHSHISHCIDLATVKSEMNMARAAAKLFAEDFRNTHIETILTLERTKLIGAFLASELSQAGINLNQDIAVITPEISNDKMILRDNLIRYIKGKNVLILVATATTGLTISCALNGIGYYGGTPVGAATIFGADFWIWNIPVVKLFGIENIPEYHSWSATECPLCKSGIKIEGLVNSYGYSKIE